MNDQLIETQINEVLNPPFDQSDLPTLYYAIAPQDVQPPFMVYTLVSDITADVLCGLNETTSTIQLDSYAYSPVDAKKAALKALGKLSILSPFRVNSSGSFEEETKLFRYQMEFSVIY
ncbi:hypothetical protein ACJVQT_23260 [Enterobacter huaxiensis]|uniref:hypothetical protein n=1 Tax=Enterobacter huaxiensis TaxID=2494702 RepID=UPI002175A41B|nr:hypothetical protein [Enterobacter huaxiensis]MCS5452498.1 hypothetical protein [Enterobacter huaxiensis]